MTGGRPVLLVEDDPLIAMDFEDELADQGFPCVSAQTLADAHRLIATTPLSAAILDMYIRSVPSFELATELTRLGVPFFFVSGNAASALPPPLAASRVFSKPVRMADVIDHLRAIRDP